MKYYLAYGSNLNIRQMRRRCPTARIVGTSEIKGYQLLFKGSCTGSYLTIEQQPKESVPVAVWGVQRADEARLDRYEGYPEFYYKKGFRLKVKGKELDCFAYIMHEDRPFGIPGTSYVRTCLEGYVDFGFDEHILLKAIEESRCRINEK